LYIWVEGDDDVRIVEKILEPLFKKNYDCVQVRPYSQLKRKKLNAFLRSIKAMQAHYIVLADINDAPCVTEAKRKVKEKYHEVDESRITVVVKEIESWYLAGLNADAARQLGTRAVRRTDDLTKEQFNQRIPARFDSRIDFMIEILNVFSIDVARKKNKSFNYFYRKYFC